MAEEEDPRDRALLSVIRLMTKREAEDYAGVKGPRGKEVKEEEPSEAPRRGRRPLKELVSEIVRRK